jgi:hypothetical protein
MESGNNIYTKQQESLLEFHSGAAFPVVRRALESFGERNGVR